jgi:subtilase family serine protease
VNDTVKNQGSGTAGPSTTSFYLSTNFSLDSTDTYLGSRNVPALGAGLTNSGSTTLTIPAGTDLGTYYILVSADDTNAVLECAETNNVSYGVTKVGPDLTVSGLTAPISAVAGGLISVTDTVKNAGGGSAGGSTTRIYLSTNFNFDASAKPLADRTVLAVAPNATNAGTLSVTIPPGTAPGLYYIIAVSDADGAVPETSETNNTRSLTIKIN